MKTALVAIIFLIFWCIFIMVKLFRKAWKEFEKESEASNKSFLDFVIVTGADSIVYMVVYDESFKTVAEIPLASDDEKLSVYDEFIDGLEM